MIKDYLSLEKMIDFIKENRSFSYIADTITKESGRSVSRQRVHQIYKKYKQGNKALFEKIEHQKKLEREENKISKLIIEEYIKNRTSVAKICSELKIGYFTLKKLMTEYGLEIKSVKEKLDYETMYKLYVLEEKTDKEIAGIYFCSKPTVTAIRLKLNITLHDRTEYRNNYLSVLTGSEFNKKNNRKEIG